MLTTRRELLALITVSAAAQTPSPAALTQAQKEQFLLKAKIIKSTGAKGGITGTTRATLSDGTLTHDAGIQTIDEFKTQFQGTGGTEFNFKDTYKFNIAAYKLDRILGLNMVPVHVQRSFNGQAGAFSWWVDDVTMTELERTAKKITPPDNDNWNLQMYCVRVFDQLIFNVDRNLGNLVIDKQWQMWMIDHSRSFRLHGDLKEAKNLVKCDAGLLAAMQKLEFNSLKTELKDYLNDGEIRGLLKRRDKIVAFFQKAGPGALFKMPRRPA